MAVLEHAPAALHDREEIAAYAKSGLLGAELKAAQFRERNCEAHRQEQESVTSPDESHSAEEVAYQYGLLKDREKVLHLLDQASHERTLDVTYWKSVPEFDFLRSDPRFQELLRRVNLPP